MQRILSWLDERVDLMGARKALLDRKMPGGLTWWHTLGSATLTVFMVQVVTGIVLAVARISGETAPLLFTAFNNQFWSHGLNQPTASLPVMIYVYATGPYADWHRQAWAAGFILLMLVLVANIGARLILSRRSPALRG